MKNAVRSRRSRAAALCCLLLALAAAAWAAAAGRAEAPGADCVGFGNSFATTQSIGSRIFTPFSSAFASMFLQ